VCVCVFVGGCGFVPDCVCLSVFRELLADS